MLLASLIQNGRRVILIKKNFKRDFLMNDITRKTQNIGTMGGIEESVVNDENNTIVTTAATSAAVSVTATTTNTFHNDIFMKRGKMKQGKKKSNTSYIPGTVTLQFLGVGSNGAPAAVYLFTDHSRYLFNCGEGTQRLAHEHKTKLARLEQIFVTRNTWPAIGGLPGLLLTVQDTGVKELSLHGPEHLDKILNSMRRFVVLKNLQLKTKDCKLEQIFEDSVMKVKSLPLYRNKDLKEMEHVVIAYMCQLKPKPGALNLEKCVEYGVPPGPQLGLLKNGIDVTLDNGNIVKSVDVSEPNENPINFIFLDIPSIDFLPALQLHKELFIHMGRYMDEKSADSNNADTESEIAVVIHFGPSHVINHEIYQEFLKEFSPSTEHIYLNSSCKNFSGYVAAHRIQHQLNQLNSNVFPILKESLDTQNMNGLISSELKKSKYTIKDNELISNDNKMNDDYRDDHDAEDDNNTEKTINHFMDINVMTSYHLRPRRGLDRKTAVYLTPQEYINETQALKDFPQHLEQLKMEYTKLNLLPSNNESKLLTATDYPKITFLGTGSCIPNKTRNVSAILLQPRPGSYVILDCGEGTLGQLQRFFGLAQTEEIIRNLHMIYISHLHADHHIGLIGLLTERLRLSKISTGKVGRSRSGVGTVSKEMQQPLLLLAPIQIHPWLEYYNDNIINLRDTYKLFGNATLLHQPQAGSGKHGIESIQTCLVKHCPHSYGVALIIKPMETNNQKPIKITYSGDTMPCQDLINLGRNSTILIHEATMEDDLWEEAIVKTHSTLSQAIQQGQAMQAQHIILTHFSQRYAKLPRLVMSNKNEEIATTTENATETEMKFPSNVSIAFDNMQITLNDLEHFHLMYPAMCALFADHAEELEQKALKRELKLERKRKLMS